MGRAGNAGELAEGGSGSAADCYRGWADPDPVRVSGGGVAVSASA